MNENSPLSIKPAKKINYAVDLLIIVGLAILLLLFAPVLTQEVNYQLKQISPQEYQLIEDVSEVRQQSFNFSLVIPKIGVNSKVFSNIDSSSEKEYLSVLKKGVAHALGSSLPNEPGSVFIFAHSTDSFYNISHYNAAFFLLRKLEQGDETHLFYKNKKYTYKVVDKKIIDNEKVNEEVKNLRGNYLVLQTCYPPGTTLKRLLIIAKVVKQ